MGSSGGWGTGLLGHPHLCAHPYEPSLLWSPGQGRERGPGGLRWEEVPPHLHPSCIVEQLMAQWGASVCHREMRILKLASKKEAPGPCPMAHVRPQAGRPVVSQEEPLVCSLFCGGFPSTSLWAAVGGPPQQEVTPCLSLLQELKMSGGGTEPEF